MNLNAKGILTALNYGFMMDYVELYGTDDENRNESNMMQGGVEYCGKERLITRFSAEAPHDLKPGNGRADSLKNNSTYRTVYNQLNKALVPNNVSEHNYIYSVLSMNIPIDKFKLIFPINYKQKGINKDDINFHNISRHRNIFK